MKNDDRFLNYIRRVHISDRDDNIFCKRISENMIVGAYKPVKRYKTFTSDSRDENVVYSCKSLFPNQLPTTE